MRFGLVVLVRVLCRDNMAFSGDFEPVLAKHSTQFDLNPAVRSASNRCSSIPNRWLIRSSIGARQITDGQAKDVIYRALIDDELGAPMHMASTVHKYFTLSRTIRSSHPHEVELAKRLHVVVQASRTHAALQVNCELRRVLRHHPMTNFSLHSTPCLLSVNAESIRLEMCKEELCFEPTIEERCSDEAR